MQAVPHPTRAQAAVGSSCFAARAAGVNFDFFLALGCLGGLLAEETTPSASVRSSLGQTILYWSIEVQA